MFLGLRESRALFRSAQFLCVCADLESNSWAVQCDCGSGDRKANTLSSSEDCLKAWQHFKMLKRSLMD